MQEVIYAECINMYIEYSMVYLALPRVVYNYISTGSWKQYFPWYLVFHCIKCCSSTNFFEL